MSEKFFKMFTVIVNILLVLSLFFNAYFYYRLSTQTPAQTHHSTFFSFVFGPTMQNITSGNLYLNLTFDVVEGNLTVKAEVNADSCDPDAALALQFDSDNNGTIDIRYWPEEDLYFYDFKVDDSQFLLRADNLTRRSYSPGWGWLPDGTIWRCSMFSGFFEHESPFHYCVYDQGIYTFFFTFPVNLTTFDFDVRANSSLTPTVYSWLNGEHGIQGKLVRVLFGMVPSNGEPAKGLAVYVPPFNFMEQ